MPLPLPNLDDRSFADLVAETRSLIPRYAKTWTNHNPSDPGITLLELLAWLTEMVLYRLNQILDRSYRNFLELIGIDPSGPQAEITFKIHIPKDELLVIERGTQVAAIEELTGEEVVFETLAPVSKDGGRWDDERSCWVFKAIAVNTIEIGNELLGISNGSPKQIFPLSQGPIFLNKDEESYEGNPQIQIYGEGVSEDWDYKNDLLESGSDQKHFTVEQLAGLVRFGDGDHGKIPAEGSEIVCNYRKLGGLTGNVGADMITILKDFRSTPAVDPSKVTVTNEYPASGGVEFESLKDLLKKALIMIKEERYRTVSDEDFEDLAKQAAPGRVARVKVVSDENLEGTTPIGKGHMSLIVLPASYHIGLQGEPKDRSCTDLRYETKESHKAKTLRQDILRYLDERRLITTVVHVVGPEFTEVNLDITVSPKPGVDIPDLEERIENEVTTFLDPYVGWEDVQGWPFGRDVYRSELYQQIEGIEGVDHVEEIFMNGDKETPRIAVAENNLVCVESLTVTVT